MPFNPSQLQPGDVLLYKPKKSSLFGLIIAIKTFHFISHCEMYIGGGKSIASRDGRGVGVYDLRTSELVRVLRFKPEYPFDLNKALVWFYKDADGQKYDYLGLLRFTWGKDYTKGNSNNRQFCSEVLTRVCRQGGVDPFDGEDADAVPPYLFDISLVFSEVYRGS